MNMRWTVIFLLLIATASGQDCILPSELTLPVTEDILLCLGSYELSEPIEIAGGSVDCQGAILNGTPEISGLVISGDSKVYGCEVRGFRIAALLNRASGAIISDNRFIDNEIGIYVSESSNNTIVQNLFRDNAGGLALNSSVENRIYGNTFYPTGLVDLYDDLNSYCLNGTGNAYINESGPGCWNEIPVEPANQSNASNASTPLQVPAETRPAQEVFQIRAPDASLEEALLSHIVRLETGATDDGEMAKRRQHLDEGKKKVRVDKTLTFDRVAGRSTIKARLTVMEDIKDLYIYEFIPKCVAENISEIVFSITPDKVLENDPLVVWHFPNANEGEELEISYDVNREVQLMPETIVITHEINISSDKACEAPISIPLIEAGVKPRNLLPLLAIPLIAVIYLYMGRFKKHFRK
jgi:parallel beta-helix repeat protein